MGFLIVDVDGFELTKEDKMVLSNDAVAGVILFAKNFQNKEQLFKLNRSIRELRSDIVIGVDHEGGRVQRFIKDFTKIPAMHDILPYADNDLNLAAHYALSIGWLIASELLEVGVDLAFSPILDRSGFSNIIGNRAFSDNFQDIIVISEALIDGMHLAGMASCGKHFPGHGFVAEDTHLEQAFDSRSLDEIKSTDLQPFENLIASKKLDSVMLAHVNYKNVDNNPVCFSEFWIQKYLIEHLGFDGLIISDDLSMKALSNVVSFVDRASMCLNSGCDLLLLCNNRVAVKSILKSNLPFNRNSDKNLVLRSSRLFTKEADLEKIAFAKDICLSIA